MLKPLRLAEDDARDPALTLLALDRRPPVLDEPPPGSGQGRAAGGMRQERR